jgi:alkanesulfonate monooxygenase SsuD/methylene tetrahydromethanopterin reductase-like flavin-dependent oxidoreductase (luciferase family)
VELGIGAGAFWDAVWAMGGPRRSPGESVDALEEAIAIIRPFLDGERSLRFSGEHYRVEGARPGPEPAHRVGLWIGAYKPRMLRLTARLGDGWLPSLGEHYLGEADVAPLNRVIDEAAKRAGRDPTDIIRAANVGLGDPHAFLDPGELARLAESYRFELLFLSIPDEGAVDFVRRLGEEVAPRAREQVGRA